MRQTIYTVASGAWIGGTMTVPGVSGGSMAMILGIYDRLITSVNGIFHREKRKESMIFLLKFLLGAAAGLFLFSSLITFLLDQFPMPTRYFFLGTVAGGVPLIFREAHIKHFSLSVIVYPALGIAAALSIAMLPEGLFDTGFDGGFFSILLGVLIQLAGGVVVAIALVLPGISVSQMLLILGLYERLTGAVSALDGMTLLSFLPLMFGTVGGILLTTNLIEKAMKRFPTATYLMIFGFILGSLPELFPGIPRGWEILLCAALGCAGFFTLYFVSKRETA